MKALLFALSLLFVQTAVCQTRYSDEPDWHWRQKMRETHRAEERKTEERMMKNWSQESLNQRSRVSYTPSYFETPRLKNKYRTWTDFKGRKLKNAKLVETQVNAESKTGWVVLKTLSRTGSGVHVPGKTLRISFRALSANDQSYVLARLD